MMECHLRRRRAPRLLLAISVACFVVVLGLIASWSSSDEDARLEFGWGKKIADEAKSIEEKITCCAADVRSSFACWGNKAKQYIGTSLGKGGNDRSESSLKANRESREGHKLLKKRTVASCSSAAEHFKKAFDFDQEPSHLRDAAEALNAVMRMQTNANAICFEGSNDIPRHKNIWKKYGSESEKLASQALKERPKDPEYLATYTDSFIFSCSCKGLVKQALTGAGSKYQSLAKDLQRTPSVDSGVGYALLGCFYQEAPWPLHSSDKAMRNMELALQKGGKSRRNLYYAGVVSYKRKEYAAAADYFKRAANAPCGSVKEADFGEWMRSESQRGYKKALQQHSQQ
mmetsp:Transcript_3794/g.5877  ORF Transcript_3794/g.5877 Transcript_3794/m.5877 type:complete len:344 (-) Transcript_3794:126-1157(-)